MATRYPEELIREVISANDIINVISPYVKLKRSGRGFSGLCPFHSEKTPSFSVKPDSQIFKCFGCGKGGNSLSFIMEVEHLDFVEALKFLAEKARIQLPEADSAYEDTKEYILRQDIKKANAEAARFYYKTLVSEKGIEAQKYLMSRGIDGETAKAFGLGYAPDSFDVCSKYLLEAGFSEEVITTAGLGRISSKTGSLYDFFRNRVMFPIFNVRSDVIAFGGRVMGNDMPKYLNSPDTPVFHKSRTLYALNIAKKYAQGSIVVAEGYMDVIALHMVGIKNSVACLGTAMTQEHVNEIKKYAGEVILSYDSDDAGQKAAQNAILVLNKAGIKVKVLSMEGSKDPDEFIRKKGKEEFESLVDAAQSSIEYRIEKLKKQYNTDIPDQKIEFAGKLADLFAELDNNVEREVYVNKSCIELGLSSESLNAEIGKIRYKNSKKAHTTLNQLSNANKVDFVNTLKYANKNNTENYSVIYENRLANLLVHFPEVYSAIKDIINPDFFYDEACRNIAHAVYISRAKDGSFDPASYISTLEGEMANAVTTVLFDDIKYENTVAGARDIIEKIKQERSISCCINQSKTAIDANDLDRFIKSLGKNTGRGNESGK